MFFKNTLAYRLTEKVDFSNFEEALKSQLAKPCTFQELASYGFIAPFGKAENAPLAYQVENYYLIATRQQERILPSSVVKTELQRKVDEIETAENRKVYKKEKDQLRDEIVQTLLPQAFIREKLTYAAIAPAQGLIFVDTTSASKAEKLLSLLREALGSLAIRPVQAQISTIAVMTDWLRYGEAKQGFEILNNCQLIDSVEDGGTIRCKYQDLTSEEITNHIKSGMLVNELALSWHNKLSFTLNNKLVIKRLKFEDILLEQADKDGGDDANSQFGASFLIMITTLNEMLTSLLAAFGGEASADI